MKFRKFRWSGVMPGNFWATLSISPLLIALASAMTAAVSSAGLDGFTVVESGFAAAPLVGAGPLVSPPRPVGANTDSAVAATGGAVGTESGF